MLNHDRYTYVRQLRDSERLTFRPIRDKHGVHLFKTQVGRLAARSRWCIANRQIM
jgi:hypothetical protein